MTSFGPISTLPISAIQDVVTTPAWPPSSDRPPPNARYRRDTSAFAWAPQYFLAATIAWQGVTGTERPPPAKRDTSAIAWTPQAKFSLVATPGPMEWQSVTGTDRPPPSFRYRRDTSAFAWDAQVIAVVGTTPATMEWQRPTGIERPPPTFKYRRDTSSFAWDPQVVAFVSSTPANMEWQRPTGIERSPPPKRDTGFIAWSPQASFSLAGTPAAMEWQAVTGTDRPPPSFRYRRDTSAIAWAPQAITFPTLGWQWIVTERPPPGKRDTGSIAWSPQASFSLTATPDAMEWQSVTADRPSPYAFRRDVSFFAWSPRAITFPTLGWFRPFVDRPPVRVKRNPDAFAPAVPQAGTPPAPVPTPANMEWQSVTGTDRPPPAKRDTGSFAFDPQITAAFRTTPSELGWQWIATERPPPTARYRRDASSFAWDPQAIVFPTLGWLQAFDPLPRRVYRDTAAFTWASLASFQTTPTNLEWMRIAEALPKQRKPLPLSWRFEPGFFGTRTTTDGATWLSVFTTPPRPTDKSRYLSSTAWTPVDQPQAATPGFGDERIVFINDLNRNVQVDGTGSRDVAIAAIPRRLVTLS